MTGAFAGALAAFFAGAARFLTATALFAGAAFFAVATVFLPAVLAMVFDAAFGLSALPA
ncbi:MAG TPA: hypothetical protein VL528_07920 [Oxalicibacterium sp.]|nr:hypothetical protein [Oxalicibacterium sp.]